jgi:hypothetical protein
MYHLPVRCNKWELAEFLVVVVPFGPAKRTVLGHVSSKYSSIYLFGMPGQGARRLERIRTRRGYVSVERLQGSGLHCRQPALARSLRPLLLTRMPRRRGGRI